MVARKHPLCPYCGKAYEAIYADRGKTFVGDTFVRWNFEGHKCGIRYKRDGDDTFLVIVDGQKPIRGRLKNWQNGLLTKTGNGNNPSSRSDLKWLTDKQYHGK